MTDRQILFSAPMVRAILDGSKTQTRRVVKPVRGFESFNICRPDMMADQDKVWWHGAGTERVGVSQSCPYGQIGDRLWVRESFAKDCDGYVYKATCPWWDSLIGKKPSIHMPRWASRITLEITDVRVERLQAISEWDAVEEGVCETDFYDNAERKVSAGAPWSIARLAFADLWQSINGAESWDDNPLVWVISFKRVEGGAS